VIASGALAVLRGLVKAPGRQWLSPPFTVAVVEYLRRFDTGALSDAVMTRHEVGGRVFYNEAMSGFEFRRRIGCRSPRVAEQVLRYGRSRAARRVAARVR